MPSRRDIVRNYMPTPEEIAKAAAEIRAEWDPKKWELQRTARERHWLPMQVDDPNIIPDTRNRP